MITQNFTWKEMTGSVTAERYSMDNYPGAEEREAIEYLVRELLQPLREYYGKAIRINSGYRCPQLNRRVGGVPTSQHLRGEAADCSVAGNIATLYKALKASGLVFDQAIVYRKRNFLHLSLRRDGQNRMNTIIR